jgi:hypothetical protein
VALAQAGSSIAGCVGKIRRAGVNEARRDEARLIGSAKSQ